MISKIAGWFKNKADNSDKNMQKVMMANGETCIKNNDIQGMKELLLKGLNPDAPSSSGTPLRKLCSFEQEEMEELFYDFGKLSGLSIEEKKAYFSAKDGDVQTLEELLKQGVSPHIQDGVKRSLYFIAMVNSRLEIMKLLAQFNAETSTGRKSLLETAARVANTEIVSYLLDKSQHDNEVLLKSIDAALARLDTGIIDILLAKVDLKNLYTDETILFRLASSYRSYSDEDNTGQKLVDMFIAKGVDIDYQNSKGQKASDIALSRRNTKLGYYLRDKENFDLEKRLVDLHALSFPEEAIEYLSQAESDLSFSSKKYRDVKEITLCNLKELRFDEMIVYTENHRNEGGNAQSDPNIEKEGYYIIPVIDLVKEVNDYLNTGLLVWIPAIKRFGTCDPDHGHVYVIENTGWKELLDDLFTFANTQWRASRQPEQIKTIYDCCKPWEIWKYK